jgi:hypothetical protein
MKRESEAVGLHQLCVVDVDAEGEKKAGVTAVDELVRAVL